MMRVVMIEMSLYCTSIFISYHIINIFVKRHRQSYRGAVNESIRHSGDVKTVVKKMSF